MPEGDTVAWAANRIRPVIEGQVPDEIVTPHPRHSHDRWPERLAGRAVRAVDTYGKHLFVRFDGGLVLHSHLGMVGSWFVSNRSPRSRRIWVALRSGDRWAVERDGPLLDLMTEARTRFDQRLASLGPDVLATSFDRDRFLTRLRSDDPTRPFGDALLDQRNVAGIGNIWKAEGCWEAGVSPWRALGAVSDERALAVIDAIRPRMQRSASLGPRAIEARVYGRIGAPCPGCGAAVRARGQGDANRTTYWCPGCQS